VCSRTRKIRCDGAKPTCHNCSRRSTNGGATCSYDSAPKRRGPDKTPGARQRTARDTNQEDIGTVRRRRRKPETASSSKNDVRNTYATDSCERQSSTDMPSPVSSIPLTPISPLSDEPSKTWSSLVPARGFAALSRTRPTLDNAEQVVTLYLDF
jgi:Fungal Zn(2)-Cys(6) binuclear cluster domain